MTQKIAIIGAGLIGLSWAITFARAGFRVDIFDSQDDATLKAPDKIDSACTALAEIGLMSPKLRDETCARIAVAQDMAGAVEGAKYVQENTPEDAAIKRAIFAELDRLADSTAIIASSTSALMPSEFTEGLPGADRCLVAHPLNPPHLIPAVELVPGPETSETTMQRAADLMAEIGQSPIRTTREVEGFIMNRLQGALLDEAFALVEQGLAMPADVDTAMRDGLARRWVFMGPFATIDLNAPGGVTDFVARYGKSYERIGAHRPNRTDWFGPVTAKIAVALDSGDRAGRAERRDTSLARLAHFIGEQKKEDHG
ncbi:3-hydroxyacyl-CoA dehydrogenase [Sulfitobacter sp. D35]|uniref:3-hydroxyacyl-CoA dehydrogenase n=1 Tax=Sulfitobacter sp. D35 TaxID=3083252 RepID=UPI00296F038A|nr:3-hydroxyacyl-CoA dehydrogenase [Sulfitobacter sp. D35]MDW4496585.1 3-hydroxyacyl-CoA dehydrogenase [Sulfitobacter sp. D35]